MRLFKRKNEEKPHSLDQSEKLSTSDLGIFAPTCRSVVPDPSKEQKRLAQLEHIFIRSKRLQSFEDVPFVVDEVRNGNIVLLDITSFNSGNEQDYIRLKRIIERIRGETRGYAGELALVNDNCVIVTPSFVKF